MSWLHDWYVTIFHGKEARRVLREPFSPDDYVEAPYDFDAVLNGTAVPDTEGPCCISWATGGSLCVHDSCWRIMGCNDYPPSYADWKNNR